MKKILNRLGLFTLKQYNALLRENKALKEQIALAASKPAYDFYNFDLLLRKYNPDQLNALFYKAVNVCYNQKPFKYLIDRWKNRLDSIPVN